MNVTAMILAGLLGGLGTTEIIVIAIVALLLFGTSRIPSIMRNLGKGIHSFKQGIEDAKEEINKEVKKAGEPSKDDDKKDDDKKDDVKSE